MNVNINQNLITYTGNVKIKVFKNGEFFRTIYNHNAGTIDFLKFIRDCVIGASNIYLRNPFYLIPIDNNDNDLASNSFSGFSVKDGESDASVIYTFLISGVNYPVGTKIKGFKLNSADNKTYAEMSIPQNVDVILDDSSNVYVEWTLTFNAAPDETTELGGN